MTAADCSGPVLNSAVPLLCHDWITDNADSHRSTRTRAVERASRTTNAASRGSPPARQSDKCWLRWVRVAPGGCELNLPAPYPRSGRPTTYSQVLRPELTESARWGYLISASTVP